MITETPNLNTFSTHYSYSIIQFSCEFNEFRERNSENDEKTVNFNLSKNFNFDKIF